MDNSKDHVVLTDFIRKRIKAERTSRKIKSVYFSTVILGNSGSYLSLIESGKIKRILKKDLIKIFKNLLNIEGAELDKYIETLLVESNNAKTESTEAESDSEITNGDPNNIKKEFEDEIISSTAKDTIIFYGKNNNNLARIGYNKAIDDIVFNLDKVFKNSPDYGFKSAELLAKNLENDIGFMVGLTSLPFYLIEKDDIETKENLFNEIRDVLQKHLDKD